jgi:hypothetical protein
MTKYIFDTGVFRSLGLYYPGRFPTVWARINSLADSSELQSVKEVRKELELNCPYEHVTLWVKTHHKIFYAPCPEEGKIVANILSSQQGQNLIKKTNILKGYPVADPFVIAAAKYYDAFAVSQESFKQGGARIPTICKSIGVIPINLEQFLEKEELCF